MGPSSNSHPKNRKRALELNTEIGKNVAMDNSNSIESNMHIAHSGNVKNETKWSWTEGW